MLPDTNKTIVITYDDATRMVDFCKDSEGNVSRDFYDWYLDEEGRFFTRKGTLIIDKVLNMDGKIFLTFDLTNPDRVSFSHYAYKDHSLVSQWIFKRQDNLTIKEFFDIEVKYLSITNYSKQPIIGLANVLEQAKKTAHLGAKKYIKNKMGRNINPKKAVEELLKNQLTKMHNDIARCYVSWLYSLMYYTSKKEPVEITTEYRKELNTETEKTIGKYTYSGLINLNESKVYKPLIKRDPDEPLREYQRHIESWNVRGHYRRTSKGLVWIEPHVKGSGELENRIYSTEDAKSLNITPKVFEVERTVKKAEQKLVIINNNKGKAIAGLRIKSYHRQKESLTA